MPTQLTPHFTLEELVSKKVQRDKCAVSFDICQENLQSLCEKVLEPLRSVYGPMGINSGLRDIAFSASLATDPAAAARVAKRPGPHCYGESADFAIIAIDKLPEPARSDAYLKAFETLYNLVKKNGLEVNEAILEYAKGEAVLGKETGKRITHIHVQHRKVIKNNGRFVARKWKLVNGVLAETYIPWKP